MNIKIYGVQDNENIVIGLKKQIVEQYWGRNIDDFGQMENTFTLRERVIEEFIDPDHIYYNDKIPNDGNIELPNFLEGLVLRIESQGFGKSYNTVSMQSVLKKTQV